MLRLILVQTVVNYLILIMGSVLVLFTLLLLTLHMTNSIKNKLIQGMREQLICLISGEAAASRLKTKLYAIIRQEPGCVESISEIHGVRSMRGLLVISEIADELKSGDLTILRREIGGEWYSKYLNQQFTFGSVDSVILVVKLAGVLGMNQYVSDIVHEIYVHRTNPHMQNIGLLSLCLLAAEEELISICRDGTIASLLSFRTLEELFTQYTGDREVLCERLINTAADQYIRRTCVKAIGQNCYFSLAPLVLPLLDSQHMNMQLDAARALGQLAYDPAYSKILSMAKSERWELRAIVSTALASYSIDQNAGTLINLLCDREWWVRYRAAESLSQSSDTEAILHRVEARQDRYALEMFQFALNKRQLCRNGGVA